jgi:hypothetical protein
MVPYRDARRAIRCWPLNALRRPHHYESGEWFEEHRKSARKLRDPKKASKEQKTLMLHSSVKVVGGGSGRSGDLEEVKGLEALFWEILSHRRFEKRSLHGN